MKIYFFTLLSFLLLPSFAAELAISATELVSGDSQTLSVQIEAADCDLFLVLSSTNGTLRSLRSDGELSASGYVVPFARSISLPELTPILSWRVTGLDVGAYGWTAVAVKPGGALDTATDRLEVASASFVVKQKEGPLFVELKEGRDGRAVGKESDKRGAVKRALGVDKSVAESRSPESLEAPVAGATRELRKRHAAVPGEEKPSSALELSSGLIAPAPDPVATPELSDEELEVEGLAELDADADGLVAIPLELPKPMFKGTPVPLSGAATRPPSASSAPPPPVVTDSKGGRSRYSGSVSGFAGVADKLDLVDELKSSESTLEGVDLVADTPGRPGGAGRALDGGVAPPRLAATEAKKAKEEIEAAKALTAGTTDDNDDFDAFLKFLRDRNQRTVMAMDVSQRQFITVLDAEGRHVSNADVVIRYKGKEIFNGRTVANGQTLFHPSAVTNLNGKVELELEVRKGLLRKVTTIELEVGHDDALRNRFDLTAIPKPMPIRKMPLPRCCPVLDAPAAEGLGEAEEGTPNLEKVAASAKTKEAAGRLLAAGKRAATAKPTPFVAAAVDWLPKAHTPVNPWTARALDLGDARQPVEKALGDVVVRLPAPITPGQPKLDLVFQIDTTGSMRDEIRAIQATLQSVANRIDAMEPQPLVRWGLVLYGDRGDAYVVRRYSFTEDIDEMHDWILNMQMTGGGDTPESALEALHASINEMRWDTGDAVRLVFLVADAPPHLDYNRDYTYLDKIKEAVAKGIKIVPTSASGLNKTGEYIFRQWAQATMGQFLYITYGAGTPAGGVAGKTPHEVDQPKKKNNLDDIIVKAVADELDDWRTPRLREAGVDE